MSRSAIAVLGVLAAAFGLVPLEGCSCQGGPYLGVTAAGDPAIGWETQGTQLVHGVSLTEADGTVVWQLATEDRQPVVIPIGEEVEGLETVVALDGDPDLAGRRLVLSYSLDGSRQDGEWSFVSSAYEPSSQRAEVKPQECGFRPPVGRALIFVFGGLVAGALVVLLGMTGLMAVLRAAVGRDHSS